MKPLAAIKLLRDKTGFSVIEIKKALEQVNFDIAKAEVKLEEKFSALAAKKAGREAKQGIVAGYVHPTKKLAAQVELLCETDFAARNEDFQKLAHELCLQVAAMHPKNVKELLVQPWIRDNAKTAQDLINELTAKIGEKIVIGRFSRLEV